jgi:ribonuclease HI
LSLCHSWNNIVCFSGSNNTAELTAIGEAFRWVSALCLEVEAGRRPSDFGEVVCRYDSEYAAKSVTGEFNGKKNTALIGRVRVAYRGAQAALRRLGGQGQTRSIRFKHVKGHAGHRWNEKADELANEGLVRTMRPEYSGDGSSEGVSESVSVPVPAVVAASEGSTTVHVQSSNTLLKYFSGSSSIQDRWSGRSISKITNFRYCVVFFLYCIPGILA